MKEKLSKLEPYAVFIIIGFLALMLFLSLILWPKKEFPVKVGQVWECTMEVVPFENNIPQPEVTKTSYDSVYRIDENGMIYYIQNGTDSLFATLETFTFKSKMVR